jgi:hypothetical protein
VEKAGGNLISEPEEFGEGYMVFYSLILMTTVLMPF